MKGFASLIWVLFLFCCVVTAHAGPTLIADQNNSVTISTMEFGAKNDNNVTSPNFSKASYDISNETIKARAYSSLGIPATSSTKQQATARLGTRFYLKHGSSINYAWVKVTYNGTYNGLIGALGVAAGRVLVKVSIDTPTNLVYDQINEKVVLDTSAGGLPSGAISNAFETSFDTCLISDHTFSPVIDLAVATGLGMKTVGVVDNDFYEGNRQVKLNWVKVQVLGSCASQVGGTSGRPQGQGPGGGRTIIPK